MRTIIRCELRKWELSHNGKAITGEVHNDTWNCYDQGEKATFIGITRIDGTATFKLIHLTTFSIRADIDEELKNDIPME